MKISIKKSVESEVEFITPSYWKSESERQFYALLSETEIRSVTIADKFATVGVNDRIYPYELDYIQIQISEKEFMVAYMAALEKIKL